MCVKVADPYPYCYSQTYRVWVWSWKTAIAPLASQTMPDPLVGVACETTPHAAYGRDLHGAHLQDTSGTATSDPYCSSLSHAQGLTFCRTSGPKILEVLRPPGTQLEFTDEFPLVLSTRRQGWCILVSQSQLGSRVWLRDWMQPWFAHVLVVS